MFLASVIQCEKLSVSLFWILDASVNQLLLSQQPVLLHHLAIAHRIMLTFSSGVLKF